MNTYLGIDPGKKAKDRIRRLIKGGCKSSTYKTWGSIKMRCKRPDYVKRGVRICERWNDSFENFLKDMGERPVGMTIDRINTNSHYEPGNCRWATPRQQMRNRYDNAVITANGRTMLLVEWSDETKIPVYLLRTRLSRGWAPERAVIKQDFRRIKS